MFDGRPMTPRLTGLPLEYRILQIYSSESGDNQGTLEFGISGGASTASDDPSVIAEWTFDDGLEGWDALGGEATAKDGIVTITSKSGPVLLQRLAPQPGVTGKLELRFWMESPQNGRGSVFWSSGPLAKGQIGQAAFSIKGNGPREYRVLLDAEDELSGLRIVATSESAIDWIRLSKPTEETQSPSGLTTTFHTVGATPVTLRVLDENEQPTTAAFLIKDEDGHIYPTQSKRLAPDFFFHPQVYRGDREQVDLPAGNYTITSWRGPESVPETRQLEVGRKPVAYRVSSQPLGRSGSDGLVLGRSSHSRGRLCSLPESDSGSSRTRHGSPLHGRRSESRL